MKRIQVGGHRKNSKIKLYAFVDSEDFEKVSKYRWIIQKNGWGQIYAYSHKEKTLMHRLIMECPEMIDHANGNGLDNRKSNLRICDKRLNMANSKNVLTQRRQPTKVYLSTLTIIERNPG